MSEEEGNLTHPRRDRQVIIHPDLLQDEFARVQTERDEEGAQNDGRDRDGQKPTSVGAWVHDPVAGVSAAASSRKRCARRPRRSWADGPEEAKGRLASSSAQGESEGGRVLVSHLGAPSAWDRSGLQGVKPQGRTTVVIVMLCCVKMDLPCVYSCALGIFDEVGRSYSSSTIPPSCPCHPSPPYLPGEVTE